MEPSAARLLLWEALSELYVDTELTDDDIYRLRESIRASGYSVADIRQINYDEIAPVLISNLFSMTGVWTGFDQLWLRERTNRRRSVTKRLMGSRRLWCWWVDYWVGSDLNRLLAAIKP